MTTEVLYADGSTSTHSNWGASHDGPLAIARIRLLTAKSALEVYIKWGGKMQLTRDGHRAAIINVIEPLSGKKFTTPSGKVTMKSCREALEECRALIWGIENGAVIYEESE